MLVLAINQRWIFWPNCLIFATVGKSRKIWYCSVVRFFAVIFIVFGPDLFRDLIYYVSSYWFKSWLNMFLMHFWLFLPKFISFATNIGNFVPQGSLFLVFGVYYSLFLPLPRGPEYSPLIIFISLTHQIKKYQYFDAVLHIKQFRSFF